MDTTLVDALRNLLRRETGGPVELLETHISWVLLTAELAYKLKKPVHLPFVDFSTMEARRHFCEEELRLNRRFAPTLYLDVIPVRGTEECPSFSGSEEPIDHLVRMRRFPESSLMRDALVRGRLEPFQFDSLGRRLATWHAAAERAAPSSDYGTPDRIVRTAIEVLDILRKSVPREAQRVVALCDRVREQAGELQMSWTARKQDGAVRECHGDLHMNNVVMVEGELTPFDCIEFEPALRWIDVVNDLAFLTMDLKAHGHSELAFRLLDSWLQHSGDFSGLRVLAFYEVYRASVRAMAAALGPKPDLPENVAPAPDYLAFASRRAKDRAASASLLITHGLSGSGKSTVALQLMCATGAVRIRSDVERKRLFGLDMLADSAAAGIEIYGEDANRRTFDRVRDCARHALGAGYAVIVDAAFLRHDERQRFRAMAAELGLPFAILDCRAEEATLRARVAARAAMGRDASEAGLQVLERQLAEHEFLDAEELVQTIQVSTDATVDIASLVDRWRTRRYSGSTAC